MAYYGSEDYDYDYHRSRHSSHLLDPARRGGRQRSHSRGGEVPVVNIYNDQYQDTHLRNQAPNPYPYQVPAPPPPPPPMAVYYEQPRHRHRSSSSRDSRESRGRRHSRLGEGLVEEMAELALRDRLRSRSRGRSDVALADRSEFYEMRLQEKEREIEEARRRQLWERESEVRRAKEEAQRARANEEAEEREKRAIKDYEGKKLMEEERRRMYEREIEERKQKEEERRRLFERELELKRMKEEAKEAKAHEEAEEKQKQLIKDYEEKKRKEAERIKKEEQEFREKMEREEREAKEKKEKQRQEFLREEKEKAEKAAAEKKAEKEKIELAMRRRFEDLGYTQAQIDFMVDEERTKKFKEGGGRSVTTTTTTESRELQLAGGSRAPVYAKIHRDYLSIETLKYYDIPYEKDPMDSDFIIVLREMTKYETDILFAHTKRLRSGQLLLEGSKEKDKQYAWYRKRDRSKSRARQIGILEFKS